MIVTLDEPTDEYAATKISRNLDNADFSLAVTVPVSSGSVRTAVDLSSIKDDKQISIKHTVTLKSTMSSKENNVKTEHIMDYATENEEKLTMTANYNASNSGLIRTRLSVRQSNGTPPFGSSGTRKSGLRSPTHKRRKYILSADG